MQVAMDVLQGYLTRLYQKDAWRMRSWTSEDYVQEGLLQYLIIEKHYRDKAVKPTESKAEAARRAIGELLATGHHYTLEELVAATGATAVSVRTALSDLKNPKYCAPYPKPLPIIKNDDGTYCFSTKREPQLITEAKHVMALFQTHWSRYIHDRAQKEFATQPEDELAYCEASASMFGVEEESVLERLTGDARALVALFTSPNDFITDTMEGIVLTYYQVRKIATYLGSFEEKRNSVLYRPGITIERIRQAMLDILEELHMTTPIQKLATATGLIHQANEPREAYLIRLMEGVSALSEAAWEGLPEDAKKAYNDMAQAHNDKKPLVGSAEGSEETPAAVASPRTTPRKTATRASVDKTTKRQSPTSRARQIIVLNTNLTAAQVFEQLKAEGFDGASVATLQSMRSEAKAMIEILKANGLYVSKENAIADADAADAPVAAVADDAGGTTVAPPVPPAPPATKRTAAKKKAATHPVATPKEETETAA